MLRKEKTVEDYVLWEGLEDTPLSEALTDPSIAKRVGDGWPLQARATVEEALMVCGSLTAAKAREPPNCRGLVVTFTQMKHGRYHYHNEWSSWRGSQGGLAHSESWNQ